MPRVSSKCLENCASDEPVFVLCGRDPLAGKCVRDWAAEAMKIGTNPEKVHAAIKLAEEMEAYEQKKFPD